MPVNFSPLLCLFLNSVTTLMGFMPAFSARVNGIIYKASAYALKIMASSPLSVVICSLSLCEISISADPPPVIKDLLFINDRITHKASCNDLSA